MVIWYEIVFMDMGFINRRKSGRVFSGSKLNVPGQGISTVTKGGANSPTAIKGKPKTPPKTNGGTTT
jgi:hypothetical protein